jgi:hypothetical protein
MNNLLDDIVNKHDIHVSTGIIGSNAICPLAGAGILRCPSASNAEDRNKCRPEI